MESQDVEVVLRAAAGRAFGEAGNPFVRLTALGLVISEHVDKIGYFEPDVEVVEKEVLPDRVRFVLRCHGNLRKSVEEIVRGFTIGCFKIAREYGLVQTTDGAPLFDDDAEIRRQESRFRI